MAMAMWPDFVGDDDSIHNSYLPLRSVRWAEYLGFQKSSLISEHCKIMFLCPLVSTVMQANIFSVG